jgi:hypothetical protein
VGFRYFLLDLSAISGDELQAGDVTVVGEAADREWTDLTDTGRVSADVPSETLAPDGTPIHVLKQTIGPFSFGSPTPILGGMPAEETIGYFALVLLEDDGGQQYVMLAEMNIFGDPISLSGQTPDAFRFPDNVPLHTQILPASYYEGSFGEPPICFAAGTLIATPGGDRPVETLQAGDLVLTWQGAAVPVLWAGGRQVSGAALRARPKWAPIRIEAGALGRGLPGRPLTVSPQHRIMLTGNRVERRLGLPAVFVPARGLLALPGVAEVSPEDGIAYRHLLLPRHAVLRANGAPAESLLPTERSLASLLPAQRAEVAAIIALQGLTDTLALPCLTVGQGRRLLGGKGGSGAARVPPGQQRGQKIGHRAPLHRVGRAADTQPAANAPP